MRAFVASMIIFALMIVVGIGADIYLTETAENISVYTDELEAAAEEENYGAAWRAYEKLEHYWQKNSLPLAAIVDHTHMGEISKSFCEIEAGIVSRESVEILLASARAKQIMQNVAENEHFYVKNIL